MAELIEVTVDDCSARAVINPPPVNAQSSRFPRELNAAFHSLNDRDDGRAAILTGHILREQHG